MRSHVRTIVVLAVAVGLIALFLHNVDLWRVGAEIIRARPEWLALSLATMVVNLAIRALRWQYLLEPLGHTSLFCQLLPRHGRGVCSEQRPARAGGGGHSPVFSGASGRRSD